ncbi:hypothetical protein [Noviluteimonas gilva]|uniref:Uncharacterized protein n=1 Tax=Noviluteimonas gilva TaxID=2682097 RepID=A0A7C9HWV3_9GAMM|nr:hypothetical protein [Lysobacter gilvus]MUV12814.1 hypothetical protein [Lysobacter gilvus]
MESSTGRNRERAVPVELVLAPDDPVQQHRAPARRVLCGAPALCVAALIAEQRQGLGAPPGRIVLDLHPAGDDDTLATRLARWTPCFALLRTLAPEAALVVEIPANEHGPVQLVLDAFGWPEVRRNASGRDGTVLLIADDASRLPALALAHTAWIACVRESAGCAALRRTLLLRGDTSFRIEDVGATPAEWTRRHAAAQPVNAMHAALAAFGARPLSMSAVCTTAAGRRRAGGDVLLGEIVREGERTLVWVDAPDRRTGESTLSRAITRCEHGHYSRVIVLGWHFRATLSQHLAMRCDSRIDVRAIACLPRGERGPSLRVDPKGFAPVGGLSQAWVERERSRSAPDVEWLVVQLGETRGEPPQDWAVDADHDGLVFRGGWHALRDAHAGVRTVRLRLPWQAAPRRVCIRALDAQGRASELLFVVHAQQAGGPAQPHAIPARAPASAQVEALC